MYNQVFDDIESGMPEADLVKKYMGFEKLKEKLEGKNGVKDAEVIAANVSRKKYGNRATQRAASEGTSPKGPKQIG